MTEKVREEPYERDGVSYIIIVEQEEGALWGRWSCERCQESGASSKSCSTVEEAVTAARTNAQIHHGLRHGDRVKA